MKAASYKVILSERQFARSSITVHLSYIEGYNRKGQPDNRWWALRFDQIRSTLPCLDFMIGSKILKDFEEPLYVVVVRYAGKVITYRALVKSQQSFDVIIYLFI